MKSRNQYANGAQTYIPQPKDNLQHHKVGSSLGSNKGLKSKQNRMALASSGKQLIKISNGQIDDSSHF